MAGTKSVGSSQLTLTASVIVASGKLVNQTEPISKTLYTLGVSGLYRISAYATITTAAPNTNTSNWGYGIRQTAQAHNKARTHWKQTTINLVNSATDIFLQTGTRISLTAE
jgi:hypothetical protein